MRRGLTRPVAVARERAQAATRAERSVDGSTREGPTLTEGRTRKTFGESVSVLGTKGPMGGFFWHRETKEQFNVTVFRDVQNILDRSSERSGATPPVRWGKE